MKYLEQDQDQKLQDALVSWAGGTDLIIVSFYFWNTGSDLQKSPEDLFRSIILQVSSQAPSLGGLLFPQQYLPNAKWADFPTFCELRRAFSMFARLLDDKARLVLLTDGLDEFDEIRLTMTELADLFVVATKSPSIKAILSSRPLAPFEHTFRLKPKLRLHELTHHDITTYVDRRLCAHSRMADLCISDAHGIQNLRDEIVDAAAGVFLWVKLVVQSLLEGFQNYDRLPDLQRRLRVLPRDLENLFRHMLHRIPAEYEADSSRIFQIVKYHREHMGP